MKFTRCIRPPKVDSVRKCPSVVDRTDRCPYDWGSHLGTRRMFAPETEVSPPVVRRSRWPLERRWTAARLPARAMVGRTPNDRPVFDFTAAMRALCADVIARCPTFARLDLSRILVTYTPCRNRSKFGMQARVTPMRFRDAPSPAASAVSSTASSATTSMARRCST